ncbi:MAG: hypothetical protein KDB07_13225, partial [Planctomycetes bacterium]|nr:hypothetical protein [Planctomycetota bacterium]
KSLISVEEVSAIRGELRYRLLESIREFAAERLHERVQRHEENLGQLHQRLAKYLIGEIERLRERSALTLAKDTQARIQIESANLLAALQAVKDHFPELGARLVLVSSSMIRTPETGLLLFNAIKSVLAHEDKLEPLTTVRVCAVSLEIALQGFSVKLEESFAERGLEAAKRLAAINPASPNAKRALAYAYEAKAVLAMQLSNNKDAVEFAKLAEEAFDDLPEDRNFARILRTRAYACMNLGENDDAEVYFDRSEAMNRRLGDDEALMATLSRAVGLRMNRGEVQRAAAICDEIEEIARRRNLTAGVAEATFNRAGILYAQQEYHRAIEEFHKAEKLYRENGQERNALVAMGNRAVVYSNVGEDERALKDHVEALRLWRARGDRMMVTSRLVGIGQTLGNLKRYQEEWKFLEEAETIARELGVKPALAAALGFKATNVIYCDEHCAKPAMRASARKAALEAVEIYRALNATKQRMCFDALAALAWLDFLESKQPGHDEAEQARLLESARNYAEEAAKVGEAAKVARYEKVSQGKEVEVLMWRWIDEIRQSS